MPPICRSRLLASRPPLFRKPPVFSSCRPSSREEATFPDFHPATSLIVRPSYCVRRLCTSDHAMPHVERPGPVETRPTCGKVANRRFPGTTAQRLNATFQDIETVGDRRRKGPTVP
ncbi:hypothetical protein PMIN03_013085 [Paraphaeosphaeria minitans]